MRGYSEPRDLDGLLEDTNQDGHSDHMIAPGTATTVTLQWSSEETIMILWSDIESMHTTMLSNMPDNLRDGIDVRTMADPITFLRSRG